MALPEVPNINYAWTTLLVEELVRQGVTRFVVSPGSRSAPLTAAIAANPKAETVLHFDERGAAFFALGNGRAGTKPAALVCTSGTAVANYLPALVEASQACNPLLVLTADRPPELIDTGANQAIDQAKIFGGCLRWYHDLGTPNAEAPPQYLLTTVAEAVRRAVGPPAGPVHLNCPFREPLAPTPKNDGSKAWLESVVAHRKAAQPYTNTKTILGLVRNEFEDLPSYENGLVVAGRPSDTGSTVMAKALAARLGWPVLADITCGSDARCGERPWIAFADLALCSTAALDRLRPECVVHFDGPLVSKRVLGLLQSRTARYLHVSPLAHRVDPAHALTDRVVGNAMGLLPSIHRLPAAAQPTPYANAWYAADAAVAKVLTAFDAGETAISEIGVARTIARLAPAESRVFAGNSMPVRDLDMFGALAKDIFVVANRGASGIDGNIATAAGIARAADHPTTAVLGDLAVLHDLNSLALLRDIQSPFVLVAINNDGGGIFHFLPIAEHASVFEPYFTTPHGMGFESAAAQFGLRYTRPESKAAFESAYGEAIAGSGATLIEVRTDREANVLLHRNLQAQIAGAVDKALG